MCFDSEGSSPSQMMAVWLPRFSRWRSTQFQAALRTPSSKYLIEMLPGANDKFSILWGGFIQSRRLACSAQKPLGSLIERAYISRYLASSIQARLAQSAGTAYIFSDILFLPRAAHSRAVLIVEISMRRA